LSFSPWTSEETQCPWLFGLDMHCFFQNFTRHVSSQMSTMSASKIFRCLQDELSIQDRCSFAGCSRWMLCCRSWIKTDAFLPLSLKMDAQLCQDSLKCCQDLFCFALCQVTWLAGVPDTVISCCGKDASLGRATRVLSSSTCAHNF